MKVPISDPKSYDQSRRLGAGSFKIMSGPSRTTVGICGKYMCVFTEDRPTRKTSDGKSWGMCLQIWPYTYFKYQSLWGFN